MRLACLAVLPAVFLLGCSREAATSGSDFNVISVSRCVANGVSEKRIAECAAWTDRALNDKEVSFSSSQLAKAIPAQSVWIQSAQVKVSGEVGPNRGRVTSNHFDLYNGFKEAVVDVSSSGEVFDQYKVCESELVTSVCGFKEMLAEQGK